MLTKGEFHLLEAPPPFRTRTLNKNVERMETKKECKS